MSRDQIDRIVAQIRSQPPKPFAIQDVRRDWFVESNAEKEGVVRRTVVILARSTTSLMARAPGNRDRRPLFAWRRLRHRIEQNTRPLLQYAILSAKF